MWTFGGLGLAILAGLGLLFMRRSSPHRTHRWVCTREGLVGFFEGRVVFYPWDVVDVVNGVFLAAPRSFHLSGALETTPEPTLTEWVEVRKGSLPVGHRQALPTFQHPDGPPEAILADLEKGESLRL